ncbi:MAG TPA: lipopolysaccharide assembly protein LapA domain-containing protein [Burkholderiales bacterium]|jgi:putative membrane protein|nr:lipopolysaccharide assembly protein LapA domain-containing protein [Burkholderiales bacterium]
MRIVTWTIRLVVFVLLVAFAAKNVEPVALRFYFGLELKAPLVLALLAAFALGALFGVAALLGTIVRQRREISLLRKPAEPAPPPVTPL